MSDPKLTRLTQLGVTAQSGDVYQNPTNLQYLRLDTGFAGQATPEEVTRDILRNSFTTTANMVGIKTGTMTGVTEMYGADYTDGTTKPSFHDLFNACQLVETIVQGIPVSAISVNFVKNEIVSGATGVGRVVVATKLTDTVIYIETTTPSFSAENITGSIAGDATATGVEVDAGWAYKFDSTSNIRLSCRGETDGQFSQLYNAIPTLSIVTDDSNIPRLNYEITGVINSVADEDQWARDGVNTSVTIDTQLPPIAQCIDYTQNDFVAVIAGTMTLDFAIENPARRNANNCSGVEGFRVVNRTPVYSNTIDMPTNADEDIFEKMFNIDDNVIQYHFGTEVGNTFHFYYPSAKLQPITLSDTDGYEMAEQAFTLTGQDDAELEIICI